MLTSWLLTNFALIVGYLLAVLGIAHMLRHRRSPSATIAWLLAFILFPYVGVALYLAFGGRKVARHQAQGTNLLQAVPSVPEEAEVNEISRLLQRYAITPPTSGNRVTLCPTGVEGFRSLQQLIEESQRTLYIGTSIFSHDDVGRDILNRLVAKAEDGVNVRLLVDGLGSIKTRRFFFEPLVKAGGQFAVFEPVLHLPFRSRTNPLHATLKTVRIQSGIQCAKVNTSDVTTNLALAGSASRVAGRSSPIKTALPSRGK